MMTPEILCKFIDNTATEAEMQLVIDWLAADPENQDELNRLDKAYCASALYAEDLRQPKTTKRGVLMGRIARYATGVAAALALTIGLAYVMMEYRTNEWAKRMTTLDVPAGHYLSLKLEDGTKVWLNSGSRLEYPLVFARGERRVKVSGEAMFDVTHDVDHPFVVETFACDVEVLGTKFDVVADAQTNSFSTALFRGSVKVANRQLPDEYCVLNPNESVHLVDGHLSVDVIDNPDEYLWTEGMISLKGLNFAELMRKFEKCYGATILIKRDDIPTIEYNHGKIYLSDGIDSALRLLQLSSTFTYTKSEDSKQIVIQ
ncbi:MAG: FecR domain-containing protein [Alistipes sp.]